MKWSVILLFTVAILQAIVAVPPHKHEHEKHLSKERLKDGIYVGRDSRHYDGGDHHSEFDHEAIIGAFTPSIDFEHLVF